MIKLSYIATGTGRCGTVYAAKYLSSIGVLCGHEFYFNRDNIEHAIRRLEHPEFSKSSVVSGNDWLEGRIPNSDSSYMVAPFLDNDFLKDIPVIHLIRNPMKVLSSFTTGFKYFRNASKLSSYEKFIYDQLPELYNEKLSQMERCCLFILRWNQMIAEKSKNRPYLKHQVESCDTKIWEFVGKPDLTDKTIFDDRKANTKPSIRVSWKQIPEGSIKKEFGEYIDSYGYLKEQKLIF